MKKFKLLTSLSTLAIVGTTMPIVATACNDDETTTKVKSITYAELKSLQDSNNLEEGQLYRITDYKATTTQTHSEAANNQFDLIVEANSKSTINENATAVLHENDTYFANSDLSK